MRFQVGRTINFLALLLLTHASNAQESKEAALQPLRAAVAEARTAKVEVLAPKSFERAVGLLQDARKISTRAVNRNSCATNLKPALRRWATRKSLRPASRAELASVIRSRDDALAVAAPQHAHAAWQSADERFRQAVDRIERNDADGARRKGAEAEVLLARRRIAGH